VIATLNLNGDYISDALAAMVGGMVLHRVPISIMKMVMRFSKRRTALHPNMPGRIKWNPGSVILLGCLMLEYLGWNEAAGIDLQGR
jgi:isocitrate dehydrogenase